MARWIVPALRHLQDLLLPTRPLRNLTTILVKQDEWDSLEFDSLEFRFNLLKSPVAIEMRHMAGHNDEGVCLGPCPSPRLDVSNHVMKRIKAYDKITGLPVQY
jgi:hypothetical protein